MALSGLWDKLTGGIIGVGIGTAAADAIEPILELAKQDAWYDNPYKPLDADQVAELVAQGLLDPGEADTEARRTGYNASHLLALTQLSLKAPELGAAVDLWRRGHITEPQLRHAFRKAGLEPQYDQAFLDRRYESLSAEELANAVQQGFVPTAGLLPDDPGGSPPYTPATEQVSLDTLREFGDNALDADHARILAELSGNPPGPQELLQMWNRGIITELAVERGIREGRTKTKWTSAIKELRHYVLGPAEYASARLRGWITKAEAEAGGALSGADAAQMELLFLNRGRPATTHQTFLGYIRGGRYIGANLTERETFDKAIVQSDLRPEYADLLWAQRYTYPTPFVLRQLAQSGVITPAQTEQVLVYQGYEPGFANQIAVAWGSAKAAGAKSLTLAELRDEREGGYISEAEFSDALTSLGYAGAELALELDLADARRIKTERNRVVTALHKLYVNRELTDQDAAVRLGEVGLDADVIGRFLPLWAIERDAATTQLTAAQIRSAYRKTTITLADAITRLEAMGYTPADATIYLGA